MIQLFSDTRDSRAAPLSLNNIVDRGQSVGRGAGDWYGPHTVAHLLAGGQSCHDHHFKLHDSLSVTFMIILTYFTSRVCEVM